MKVASPRVKIVSASLEREIAMRDLASLVKIFENVEAARTSAQRRQTHLGKQVICLDCLERIKAEKKEKSAIWVPTKQVKSCPRCISCGRNLAVGQKNIPGTCNRCSGRRCHSGNFQPAGREDPFIEAYLPPIQELEERLRVELCYLIGEHPLWQEWAKDVKGLGEITLARVMGHCNIKLLGTPTKMWAHAGLGLNPDGSRQRKISGKTINFDNRLQSITTILGECLVRALGKYYQFFRQTRERALAAGLTPGHSHNHAFRLLRKLALDHIWRKWREVEGLPVCPPYVIEKLGHTGYISPEEMRE